LFIIKGDKVRERFSKKAKCVKDGTQLYSPVSIVQAVGKIAESLRATPFSQFVSAQVIQNLGSTSMANAITPDIHNDAGTGSIPNLVPA
jgi:hypothetical protein